MPKVSIVIPVYNTKEYLRECLDSVVKQTLQDIEIILVDDGSTDGSTDICREYAAADPRIKLIVQKNAGAAAARRAGVRIASGAYLGFADSDDTVEPDMYEALLSAMDGCDLVTSGAISESGNVWKDELPVGVYSSPSEMQYIIDNMIVIGNSFRRGISAAPPCKLFRTDLAREILEEVNTKIFIGEDAEFVFRYLLRCRSICITDICKYHYRIRNGSAMHSVHPNYLQNMDEMYRSFCGVFSEHPRRDRLIEQTQLLFAWFFTVAYIRMGFSPKAKALRHINPLYNELVGKKVALYGAGDIGRDYYIHMARMENEPVIWVSRSYQKYQKDFPTQPVDALETAEFDFLVIAVKEKEMAEEIKAELIGRGIEADKILWKEPIKIV